MSEKIRGEHLQRGAYVYVRQSTPYQVRNHLEGKRTAIRVSGASQATWFCECDCHCAYSDDVN
jgi:hypothetical protein